MARNFKSFRDNKSLSLQDNIKAIKSVPRFFQEVSRISPSIFISNIIARIFAAFTPVALLYIGKLLIDAIIATVKEGQVASHNIYILIAIELSLVVFADFVNRYVNYSDGLIGDLYNNESSVKIILKTKEVEIGQLEDPDFYDKLERARTQTMGRVQLLSNALAQIQSIITVGSLLVGLIAFEPWLIIVLVVSIIPSFINEFKFSTIGYSVAKSWTSERRELDYLRYIGANDKTAKELKLFGLSEFIAGRFKTLAIEYYHINKQLALRRSGWGFLFNILGTLGYYGAYVIIIKSAISGVITIGDLTFLSGSFNRLKSSMEGIFGRFTRISESALYLQDYFDFIDLKSDHKVAQVSTPLPTSFSKGFEFRDVTFKYPGSDEMVLKGVNFNIKPNEKIAFVGENGAGKTTLIKLMLRFYEPTSGHIYLDGVDIANYDKEHYQQLFGVIFQDFVRYELDVRENIAVGKIEALDDEERILKAADLSLAQEVVEQLPKGLDQQLGKRFKSGSDLSGGQWQKIALARAYMKDAPILILDEPTAALDARAEYEAFQRFINLTEGKMAVIISHRFSTVRMADKIVVLVNGIIKEQGSHQVLLQEEGTYAELFQLQAQGYQ